MAVEYNWFAPRRYAAYAAALVVSSSFTPSRLVPRIIAERQLAHPTHRRRRRCILGRAALVAAMLAGSARVAAAQVARDSATDWSLSAATEGERYLRTLQDAGLAPAGWWTIRPFAAGQLRAAAPDSTHPWSARFAPRPAASRWIHVVDPQLGGILNSGFPYGMNDGAVWAGRGLTVVASGGVAGAFGPLEFSLQPIVFRTQNASAAGYDSLPAGVPAFSDPYNGNSIDLPQRFGSGAYQRFDPGQSYVQLHVGQLVAGLSTQNEAWGPATESPYLFGVNAAGFAHVVIGTDGPLALGPVRLAVRGIMGTLAQSDYSVMTSDRRRFVTGTIVTVGTTYVPGLEVGLARVSQGLWPDSGFGASDVVQSLVRNTFGTRLGSGSLNAADDLASVFARWAFPRSGFELYGELGREDNAWDLRDLILEPDHDVAYMLGLERVWRVSPGRLFAIRGELLNSSISHLDQVRHQAPLYVHTPVEQGFTQIGQVIGAPGGYGGGAASIALDWLSPQGRRTLTWRRTLREPVPEPFPRDVMHSLTADWYLFRPRIDLAPEATLVYNLNRTGVGDALNVRLALAAHAHW